MNTPETKSKAANGVPYPYGLKDGQEFPTESNILKFALKPYGATNTEPSYGGKHCPPKEVSNKEVSNKEGRLIGTSPDQQPVPEYRLKLKIIDKTEHIIAVGRFAIDCNESLQPEGTVSPETRY